MSKTVSTCICDTNLVPNQPQENVFFHSLYRTKEDFNSEFLRSATSTSPIQIMALFSTQGPDNLGAYLNIELARELQAIANEVYKNSVLDFDSFANKVINTLNVKVCNFVVKNGGTPLKTSMSLAVIEGDILRIISVGNTRAVLIRDGRIFSLSEEQTVAHRYAQMGVISAEQEATHPENMTLTQYLGKMPQDGQVMADTKVHLKLKDNDEICLMGIGISKKVPASLRNRVLVAASQPEIKCKELISAAFNREVKAGMTVMVMKIESVFLLPGDAVFGADPSHEVANKKQESSYEGESSYTDFTKENQKNSNNTPSSQKRNYSADSEEGTTTMFNSGKINADPVTKGKKNKNEGKKENKLKNILIPIIILLVFTGLGYLIMFVAFNAVHLLDFFDKKDTDIADTEAIVMYSIQDNVPVYESDSLDSAIIGTLNRGDVVSAKSVGETFTKVSTTAGVEGYVLNAQLSEEDPTITDELPEIETEVTPIPTEDTTEETTEATETEATTQATEATTAATEATTTAATTEATTTAATTEATTTTAATESTTTEATSTATSETSQTSSTETAAPSETPAESNVTPDQGEVTEN